MSSLESAAPARSLEQRMSALDRANEIRLARADLKRDLKAKRKSVVAVIQSPPEYVLSMKAHDLLIATPKIGRVKSGAALSRCRISPSKTVGGLTERQRRELVSVLRDIDRGKAVGDSSNPWPERLEDDLWRALNALRRLGGLATASELAKASRASTQTTAGRLQALQARGLVSSEGMGANVKTWRLTGLGFEAAQETNDRRSAA
jgi:DNA-binding MarR family transcriptional regulator